jgi:hypothetical protein
MGDTEMRVNLENIKGGQRLEDKHIWNDNMRMGFKEAEINMRLR